MARLSTALLGRTLAPAGALRGRGAAPARRRRRALTARARALVTARSWAAAVWQRRRVRLLLLSALGALALAAGGWLFLRHSSLAAVEHVQVSGVHGADAVQIDAALSHAARGMSTLDVNRGALLAAVAPLHLVRDLSLSPSFPHGLRIHVIEQPPVAVLLAGGTRTAVAADGVVLGSALLAGSLPTVHASGAEPLPGQRVAGASTRAALSVLGAVPQTLLGWIQNVYMGPEGLTVALRGGLLLYFGNATRPHAKWLAAARVLADPSSAGASYIDVRLPERPAAGSTAAGGFATSDSPATQVSASDPSAAALAATLDEAVAGGANTSAAATSSTATPSEPGAATSPPSEPGVATSATSPPSGSGAAASESAATSSEPATTAGGAASGAAEVEPSSTTGASAGGASSTPAAPGTSEPSTSSSG